MRVKHLAVAAAVLAAGDGHTLALVGGQLYGCGANADGESTPGTASGPVLTPTRTSYRFSQVVASGRYSLGLTSAGAVLAWGAGSDDELGTGNDKTQLTPVQVDSGVTIISATARDSADVH
jgi:alpha-tubulin suppressor-like RCC1 family protein